MFTDKIHAPFAPETVSRLFASVSAALRPEWAEAELKPSDVMGQAMEAFGRGLGEK